MKSITLFLIVLIAVIYFSSCEYNPVEPYDPTPKVSIVNPVNNSSVSDSVTVSILVNNINVKRVELFIDHNLVYDGVFENPPYEYFWDCRWYQDGTQHILQAKAYNQSGKVIESDYTIINIYRFMPSGLTADITSDSTIFLHWYDNCKFETSFQVESATEDSNFIKIADLDMNRTSFTFNGQFVPEQQYLFRVRAVANDQYSGYSNIAVAEIKLAEPINLGTSLTSDTSITFSWTDNNSFEIGYVISKDYGSGFFVPIKTLPANSTNAVISDVILVNQQYRYTVHAVRDYYESAKALFPFVPLQLNNPDNFRLTDQTLNSVTFQWQDNSSFETGFIIYRRDSNDNTIEAGRVNTNITSFVDNGVDTSQIYNYYVKAVSTYNISGYSNSINVFYSPYISLNKIVQVPNTISEAVVSEDFSLVAMGGYLTNNRCVRIIDMNTGTILKTLPGRGQVDQQFVSIAMSPDNKYVAAVGDYFTATIWDINTGQVYKYLNFNGSYIRFIKFSQDSKSIILGKDTEVRIYNMTDWTYRTLIDPASITFGIAIDKGEKNVVLVNDNSDLSVYDYQTGVFKYDIPNSSPAGQPYFDPSGKRLSFSSNNKFIVWDVESNSLVKSISNFGYPVFMGVSPDEKLSSRTGVNNYGLELWNVHCGFKIGKFNEATGFVEIYFSQDNQRVFTREFSHSYYLWNIFHKWVQNIN
ncbi:MAG: Ig-like domain-containing protein [Ignavibacterium sp.]|jgi:WD40 repeat protein|nr:Ig-like domain-containing protein [Ignavibacterium sp.]